MVRQPTNCPFDAHRLPFLRQRGKPFFAQLLVRRLKIRVQDGKGQASGYQQALKGIDAVRFTNGQAVFIGLAGLLVFSPLMVQKAQVAQVHITGGTGRFAGATGG